MFLSFFSEESVNESNLINRFSRVNICLGLIGPQLEYLISGHFETTICWLNRAEEKYIVHLVQIYALSLNMMMAFALFNLKIGSEWSEF